MGYVKNASSLSPNKEEGFPGRRRHIFRLITHRSIILLSLAQAGRLEQPEEALVARQRPLPRQAAGRQSSRPTTEHDAGIFVCELNMSNDQSAWHRHGRVCTAPGKLLRSFGAEAELWYDQQVSCRGFLPLLIVRCHGPYSLTSVRHGVVSYADSLDCVGVLGKTADTVQQVFGMSVLD